MTCCPAGKSDSMQQMISMFPVWSWFAVFCITRHLFPCHPFGRRPPHSTATTWQQLFPRLVLRARFSKRVRFSPTARPFRNGRRVRKPECTGLTAPTEEPRCAHVVQPAGENQIWRDLEEAFLLACGHSADDHPLHLLDRGDRDKRVRQSQVAVHAHDVPVVLHGLHDHPGPLWPAHLQGCHQTCRGRHQEAVAVAALVIERASPLVTFSEPFKEKCISEVARIGSIIVVPKQRLPVGIRHFYAQTPKHREFTLYGYTRWPVPRNARAHDGADDKDNGGRKLPYLFESPRVHFAGPEA